MGNPSNEFAAAFDYLASCVGTIACGCQMTEREETDAMILWRICREYVDEFEKMKMPWKTQE